MNALLRFIREEEGISSLEYALIAVLMRSRVVMTYWSTTSGRFGVATERHSLPKSRTWLDGMGP